MRPARPQHATRPLLLYRVGCGGGRAGAAHIHTAAAWAAAERAQAALAQRLRHSATAPPPRRSDGGGWEGGGGRPTREGIEGREEGYGRGTRMGKGVCVGGGGVSSLPRTKRTRLVPPPVLSGHVSSFPP